MICRQLHREMWSSDIGGHVLQIGEPRGEGRTSVTKVDGSFLGISIVKEFGPLLEGSLVKKTGSRTCSTTTEGTITSIANGFAASQV